MASFDVEVNQNESTADESINQTEITDDRSRRSFSPDEEDIEIVNYQDYLSLNDFSQVIFLEMKDTYAPGNNVECHYKVTQGMYPHPKDRVCLFRLGWISPQDYKTYMWSVTPNDYVAGSDFDNRIVFSAAFVPQESSENYYQFCYINHQEQIRGASTPFQFKNLDSDNNGQNQSAACQVFEELNERIETLSREREDLRKANSEKDSAVGDCKRKIELLERQLEDHEELVATESRQLEEIDVLGEKVDKLEKEVARKSREMKEQTSHYEMEIERSKAAQLEQGEMYETLVKQASKLQDEKREVCNERTVLQAEKEDLQKELTILQAENEKIKVQLGEKTEEYSDVCKLLEIQENDLEEYRLKLENEEKNSQSLLKELESQRQQLKTLKAEYEESMAAQKQHTPDQLAGPVYALKTALDHTQSKLEQVNLNQEKMRRDIEFYKRQIDSKKEQVESEKAFSSDLLVRLDMAKLSYKMKYVEAGRYRRELKNVLKQDKQLFKSVCEDIEQQVKVIETEWKMPDNRENVTRDNPQRALSLCNDATMDELLNDRMVTAMEGASNCTDSVYMDAIQTPASASNAVVTAPCAVCTSKGDASKVTTATNTLAVVGSTSQSPSKLWNEAQEQLRNELNNITSWKVNDLCLITCMDTLDRLGYVIDLEKSQKKVVVGVAYQVPRSLVGSAGGAGISAAELQTMLETEESTFDRIRPYKGETVPSEVWMKVCEHLFNSVPSPRLSSDSESIETSNASPLAHSTLSSAAMRARSGTVTPRYLLSPPPVPAPETPTSPILSARVGCKNAQSQDAGSIGGVGWGSLAVPLKHMISTTAGTAVDIMALVSSGQREANSSDSARTVDSLGSTNNATKADSGNVEDLIESMKPGAEGETARVASKFEDDEEAPAAKEENKCLLCDKTFSRDVSAELFNSHMEEHYGPSCPFCSMRFPKSRKGEKDLTNHVNAHLAELGDM